MTFSLVLCTINRTDELARFLESLGRQTHRDYELVIVDQNTDDRLVPVLGAFRPATRIVYLRSAPGLTRGRNVALGRISGDVVAFPDDDCWYPDDLLQRVSARLQENHNWDGLTGVLVDDPGRPKPDMDKEPGLLTRKNVWRRGNSNSIFLRSSVTAAVGRFDETLGPGAASPWWAGDETDYLLSAIEKGFRIYYVPTIRVYHPWGPPYSTDRLKRIYHYVAGMGRVLRKHRYPALYVLCRYFLRITAGIVIAVLRGDRNKAVYRWVEVKALFRGYVVGA
jgi:glycosyltransferase involved in cell wall biosynthesis